MLLLVHRTASLSNFTGEPRSPGQSMSYKVASQVSFAAGGAGLYSL